MAESDIHETIAAARAAIANGEIEKALAFRGLLSREVDHHPHLKSEYYKIYDGVTALLRLPSRIN